jgi:hypothetical protein
MARKLNPQEDRLLIETILASESVSSLEDDPLFQNIAARRDKQLRLSPELLEFFEPEFPLPPLVR